MKILAICGSPRKGNTEFMLNIVLEAAAEKGAETELILLREKDIKHCNGCDVCFGTEVPCPIDDDMKAMYDDLLKCDLLLLGSPNYFKNVSSLMKTFIDRTNAIVSPPKLKGKKAAIVCVGGQDTSNIQYCENVMKEFVKDYEMELVDSVIAKADAPGEISDNKQAIEKLKKLGEKIAK